MNKPTIDSIRRLAGDASYIRGVGYFNEGRVYDAMQADDLLTGRCRGSSSVDYSMEMVLGTDGVVSGSCTCPRGGFCKHVVALGLLRVERPEEVLQIDRQGLGAELRECDFDQLVELIVDHAAADLDFGRRVVESFGGYEIGPAPTGVRTPPFASLVERYQEEAERAVPEWSTNPYRAGLTYASAVRDLLMRAARDAARDPVRLLACYTGFYRGIENSIGIIDDSDGAVGGAACECISGMGDLIDHPEIDSETRLAWVEMVVPLYLENDYGIGDELAEALREVGSTNEADTTIEILRAEIRRLVVDVDTDEEDGRYTEWSLDYRKMIGYELIAELLRRAGREDEIDSVYLEGGLHYHFVLHRIANEDSAGAFEHAHEYLRDNYDVRRAAEAFLDAGMTGEAVGFLDHVVPLLSARAPHRKDIFSLWARAAERTGDAARALELRRQVLREFPSVDTYEATMQTAKQLGREEEFHHLLIRDVADADCAMTVLTEIHIHRRDVNAAIDAFEKIERYRPDTLALQLAALAAKSRPEVSRRLISDIVEQQISRRSRSHYAQAAALVVRLRDLIQPEEFGEYVADLRMRYKRLPALQDELDRAFATG